MTQLHTGGGGEEISLSLPISRRRTTYRVYFREYTQCSGGVCHQCSLTRGSHNTHFTLGHHCCSCSDPLDFDRCPASLCVGLGLCLFPKKRKEKDYYETLLDRAYPRVKRDGALFHHYLTPIKTEKELRLHNVFLHLCCKVLKKSKIFIPHARNLMIHLLTSPFSRLKTGSQLSSVSSLALCGCFLTVPAFISRAKLRCRWQMARHSVSS